LEYKDTFSVCPNCLKAMDDVFYSVNVPTIGGLGCRQQPFEIYVDASVTLTIISLHARLLSPCTKIFVVLFICTFHSYKVFTRKQKLFVWSYRTVRT
jgi:hypothetical protein